MSGNYYEICYSTKKLSLNFKNFQKLIDNFTKIESKLPI